MNLKERGASLGLEESEFRELMELFRQSCGSDIRRLQESLADGDYQQALHCAHTIKGSSANLGLLDMSAAARRVEDMVRDNSCNGLEPEMKTLKALFEAALKEVPSTE
jgi:histidine phosphotransfer protein HptB